MHSPENARRRLNIYLPASMLFVGMLFVGMLFVSMLFVSMLFVSMLLTSTLTIAAPVPSQAFTSAPPSIDHADARTVAQPRLDQRPNIRSQAELDAWLQQHADGSTPLDRMPPGARMRFLTSLRFGKSGLGGFDMADLGATLSPQDIHAVLALFGPDSAAYAEHVHSTRTADIDALMSAPMDDVEQRFNQLYLFEQRLRSNTKTDAKHASAIAGRYHALFPHSTDSSVLRDATHADLRLRYRAAGLANFHAPDPTAADAMARTLAAMDARGIASPDEVAEVRDALLAAHRFAAARRFTHKHASAHLPPLPRFIGTDADLADGPSLWQYDDAGDTLTRIPVDLAPLQILVLAGCHFSVDAANDITADPKLGPLFHRDARWLSLPPGQEDLQAVRDWNRERPDVPMEMLYARSEWPMFSRWDMPTFYVVQDGKIIGSVRGWSPTSRNELTALLRRTGLLSPVTQDTHP